jgi:hypothetical protein
MDSTFRTTVNATSRELGSTNAPTVARHVFRKTVQSKSYFNDQGVVFVDDDLGVWAYDGCYEAVRSALKHGEDPAPDERQSDLFDAMPKRAYLPEDSRYAELPGMNLFEWRSAYAFKRKKAAETLAEAKRMEDFEREHLTFWEKHPKWTAEQVARRRRRGRKAA